MNPLRRSILTFSLTFCLVFSFSPAKEARSNPALLGWDVAAGIAAAAGFGFLVTCEGVRPSVAAHAQAQWLAKVTDRPFYLSQVALNRLLAQAAGAGPSHCTTTSSVAKANLALFNSALLSTTVNVMNQIIFAHHHSNAGEDADKNEEGAPAPEEPMTNDEKEAARVVKALVESGVVAQAQEGARVAKTAIIQALAKLPDGQAALVEEALTRLTGQTGDVASELEELERVRLTNREGPTAVPDAETKELIRKAADEAVEELMATIKSADRILRSLGLSAK